MRLKLFLSLLWVAAKAPYTTSRPAHFWAALLGLDDHYGTGARRIQSAVASLQEEGLITRETFGSTWEIALLNETGSGESYSIPGVTGSGSDPEARREFYFRIPETFWTRGWITALSAAATCMFLILLAEGAYRDDKHDGSSWFTPARVSKRYGIGNSTRNKGLKELERWGIVTTVDQLPLERAFSTNRKPRKIYQLDLARLARGTEA